MHPIKRTGLVSNVIDFIRAEIELGNWPVGARIPTEPELALLTGIGRGTVGEAVQSLVNAGMLERRQGTHTFVMANSVVCAVRQQASRTQRRELLELRQALDVAAATLAATRRDDTDIAALRGLVCALEHLAGRGDIVGSAHADAALHRAIVTATHNSLYAEVYHTIIPTMELEIEDEIARLGSTLLEEHSDLVEAIVAGDADGAAHVAQSSLDTQLHRLG